MCGHFHGLRRKGLEEHMNSYSYEGASKHDMTWKRVGRPATLQWRAQAGKMGRHVGNTCSRIRPLAGLDVRLQSLDFRKASVPFKLAAKVFAFNQQLAYLFLKKFQAYDLIRERTIRV